VVGQHAERRFTADSLEASGEKSPAGCHSFDGSEGMFGGASALSDQARIGLETGVHSFERVLMQMAADKATLCGGTSRLERAAGAIARRIKDKTVAMHHLLTGEPMTRRAYIGVRFRLIDESRATKHRAVAPTVYRPISRHTGRDAVSLAGRSCRSTRVAGIGHHR